MDSLYIRCDLTHMKRGIILLILLAVLLMGAKSTEHRLPGSGAIDINPAEQSLLNKYIVNLQQSIGVESTAQQLAGRAHPRLLLPSGGQFKPQVLDNDLRSDFNKANWYKLPVMVISVRTIRTITQPMGNDQILGKVKEYTLERSKPSTNEPGTIWLLVPTDSTLAPMLYEIGKL